MSDVTLSAFSHGVYSPPNDPVMQNLYHHLQFMASVLGEIKLLKA